MYGTVAFDVSAAVLALSVLALWHRSFCMRGVTYRSTVIPAWQERVGKGAFYLGLLGIIDALLRRSGQLISYLGLFLAPGSEFFWAIVRFLFLWFPFCLWALNNPLNPKKTTRDDSQFSLAAQNWGVWHWLSKNLFKHTSIVLSEDWLDVSKEDSKKWQQQNYIVCMHPHGLYPLGAIIVGLTWGGGGLQGLTASGARMEEPKEAGKGLHQRWFYNMQLRAAVASGAAGLFPIFYEIFTGVGAFECTKPFIKKVLRENKSVAIYTGGAAESKYARPGRYVCFCKSHKGSVRLALEERHNMLMCWTFGDEAILPQNEDPPQVIQKLQILMKECLGLLVPPVFSGLPQFNPITMVASVPVSLEDLWPEKVGDPVSEEAVNEGMERYIKAMRQNFDRNKGLVLGGHQDAVLEFV